MTQAAGVTQRFILVVPPHVVPTTRPPAVGGVLGELPRTGAGPLLSWLVLLALVLIVVGSLLVREARARRS